MFRSLGSSAKFVGNHGTTNGLMEMPRPWKSAKSADSHRRLENSRHKAARLSHISTGPASFSFYQRLKNPEHHRGTQGTNGY
jgi:hypothetical protein